jgi:hypothetical protein
MHTTAVGYGSGLSDLDAELAQQHSNAEESEEIDFGRSDNDVTPESSSSGYDQEIRERKPQLLQALRNLWQKGTSILLGRGDSSNVTSSSNKVALSKIVNHWSPDC